MGERQFGPYRLIRQIAVGGMAEIHLAKTAGIAGFEKYVALKMIHPNFAEDDQFIQMLVDEAKIAVQLTHGNIAQTFDLGRVGQTYYITMEYVDGADLYKILRRASEQDLDLPLDICAFIGKEISSALDHAHRKRDHQGKPLGIVHRDVSPQNVLVSYSGEVKLVDFGIAKATMKVRQTAVGVIKGKYYYMSPEQAWGDPIDHRSDIFSAGIVLYEMITGQMLYLEEDLHKLLELARSAEIAPPSKLRRGVPPQLERIVMHALAKVPGERYQSAADFATDLERFLHAYSPVFTAPKLSALLRRVIGDPQQVPDDPEFQSIEFRDGAMSTHPLDDAEVAHSTDREAIRDENSVIFRMSELEKRSRAEASSTAPPTAPPLRGAALSAPRGKPAVAPRLPAPVPLPKLAARVTRATDAVPVRPPPLRAAPARPVVPAKIPPIVKPRQPDEDTRQLAQAAPANPAYDDGSGLLLPDGRKLPWETTATDPGEFSIDDLDNIADRTQVSALPGMTGFMTEEDGPIEATLVTSAPVGPGFGDSAEPAGAAPERPERHDDSAARSLAMEHPTLRARPKVKPPVPPAALSANIHAPAVSELRKPRASRRTPPGGSPSPSSVLQAIVASQSSEPMPAPRPTPAPHHPAPPASVSPGMPAAPHMQPEPYPAFPAGTPGIHGPYADAAGRSLGAPTTPGLPPPPPLTAFPPYRPAPGLPPGYPPAQVAQQGYPGIAPNGASLQRPVELSMTGQLRLYEADELPPQFQLGAPGRRWFTYIASGVLAVTVAAVATFLIVRAMRDTTPPPVNVRVDSVPANATVLFDGTVLPQRTPMAIPGASAGRRHTIRVELSHYEPYEEQIDMPHQGGEVAVMATLKAVADKILIESVPSNAEIRIDGALRGRTPATISGVDRDSAKLLELRLKDYQPYQKSLQDVTWPPDGKLKIYAKLVR